MELSADEIKTIEKLLAPADNFLVAASGGGGTCPAVVAGMVSSMTLVDLASSAVATCMIALMGPPFNVDEKEAFAAILIGSRQKIADRRSNRSIRHIEPAS